MNKAVAKLNALTGLRFLAALAVFVFHVDAKYKLGVTSGPVGGIAVSFFFVLSGFILTYVYHDRLTWSGVPKYYFTRWARIWPLHAICMVAFLLFFYPPPANIQWPSLRLAAHWLLLQSWVPDENWIHVYNAVSWSISVEFLFYVLFPLFVIGGRKHFWWKYLTVIGVTALCLQGIGYIHRSPELSSLYNPRSIVHYNPLMRLFEFVSGIATGYLFLLRAPSSDTAWRIPQWPLWAQTVLEAVVVFIAATGFYWLQWFGFLSWIYVQSWAGPMWCAWLVYSCGTFFHCWAIYVFAQSSGWLARSVGCRLMVFLGEISFALYMVHQLVMRIVYDEFWVGSDFSIYSIIATTLVVSLGLSALLYLLFEIPLKNGLVSLYDGNVRKSLFCLWQPVKQFFTSRRGQASLATLIVPILIMMFFEQRGRIPMDSQRAVAATPAALADVSFGDDIQLLGCEVIPRRGGVRIDLVWQVNAPVKLNRFVHSSGTKFPPQVRGFAYGESQIGSPFSETVFLRERLMTDAHAIAIGFSSPETGPLPVSRGPRTEDNTKLLIQSQDQIATAIGTIHQAMLP